MRRSFLVAPLFTAFALAACAFAINAVPAVAQAPIPDSLWVRLDDGVTTIARRNGQGEGFPAEWFTASYLFQMYADSSCETDYRVNLFKINGRRWPLRNWKNLQAFNYAADYMSFNSRTV